MINTNFVWNSYNKKMGFNNFKKILVNLNWLMLIEEEVVRIFYLEEFQTLIQRLIIYNASLINN